MKDLMIMVSCGALVAVLGFFQRREQRLAQKRRSYSLADFVEKFSSEGIPERIAVEVFRYFQNVQTTKDFPVHPEDDLYKVYGVYNEDLDDAVVDLADRCGCGPPTNEKVKGLDPVRTIEDMVRLLGRLCS